MGYHFLWINDQDEILDGQQIGRLGLDMVQLTVSQQEGTPQRALVVVPQSTYKKMESRRQGRIWARIHQKQESGEGTKMIFQGRLEGLPVQVTSEFVTLQFVAQAPDIQAEEDAFIAAIKADKSRWDPLFDVVDQKLSPLDACVGSFEIPYWDPCTGKLERSNIFRGKHEAAFGGEVLADGFSWAQADMPYGAITVTLKASWLQEASGEVPLGHLINQAFPQGLVSTYTGPALERRWWSVGTRFHGGSYEIIKSYLEKVRAAQEGDPAPQQYEARLDLRWSYAQNREEKLGFTLEQQLFPPSSRRAAVTWQLGDLAFEKNLAPWQPNLSYEAGERVLVSGRIYKCQESHISGLGFWLDQNKWVEKYKRRSALPRKDAATFMDTGRGRDAVSHALKRAQVLLGHSARCVRVKFAVPLAQGLGLSLDHSVTLTHALVPGGVVTGKVVRLDFVVDGPKNKALARVELAASVGNGREMQLVPETAVVIEAKGPLHGLVDPKGLGPKDFLQKVVVQNESDQQQEQIQGGTVMGETKISLYLRDLSAVSSLEQSWQLKGPLLYSAPGQVSGETKE